MKERWVLPKSIGQCIETPGVDFGPKGLTFEYRFMNHIIAKNGGHRGFISRGAQTYHPARWIVGQIMGRGTIRGEGLECGVEVLDLCSLLVSPDRSASFQRAVKVCKNPDLSEFWNDRCSLCLEYRGEHRYGTQCTHDRHYEPTKDPNLLFQKKH